MTPPLPIEERMKRSIERLVKESGYTLDQISWDDRNGFTSVFDRAKKSSDLRLYEFLFRTSSHVMHGTGATSLCITCEKIGTATTQR
jgi:hypothetical protein